MQVAVCEKVENVTTPRVMMKDATVVVIGAGAAGIMAARKLREQGFTKVITLEARDRAGVPPSASPVF